MGPLRILMHAARRFRYPPSRMHARILAVVVVPARLPVSGAGPTGRAWSIGARRMPALEVAQDRASRQRSINGLTRPPSPGVGDLTGIKTGTGRAAPRSAAGGWDRQT